MHSTPKPEGVPRVKCGSLWYDNAAKLLYTGYTGLSSSFDLDSDSSPSPRSLWTFKPDNLGSGTWNEAIPPKSVKWHSIKRTYHGYQAYGNGSAYILGGTDKILWDRYLYPGMVQFDMSSQRFSNLSANSGATSPSGNPGFKGAMQYVPPFGPAGIFIVMGGQDINNYISFSYVLVFNPESGLWSNQSTTGSPPAPRANFCTAGIASTNGTCEIFVYGGGGGNLGTEGLQFDTVNILSLPAFNWFSVAYNPQNPRSGHTCEAVGGSLIMVVGGIDSNPTMTVGDFNAVFKSSFTRPDPFAQGIAIFDLQALGFADQYTAEGGDVYDQNPVFKQFYENSSYSGNLGEGVSQLMKDVHFPPSTTSVSAETLPPSR